MKNYIVCEERANHSRIHIKICQNRCEHSAACPAFREYINAHPADEVAKRSEAVSWPGEKLVFPTPA
jgi:hypothetical protein